MSKYGCAIARPKGLTLCSPSDTLRPISRDREKRSFFRTADPADTFGVSCGHICGKSGQ